MNTRVTPKIWMGASIVAVCVGALVPAASARSVATRAAAPVDEASPPVAETAEPMGDPGFGDFLGPCERDADCRDGNVCATFNKHGHRCTHACQSSADCVGGPVSRCTKQNRCGLTEGSK
jgi:hypothetical protein